MNETSAPLGGYEAIAEASGRMLGAARQNDWDRFVAEERRCRELVAGLQALPELPLTESDRARKSALLRRMLADDAEIRNLAEPWMRHLQEMLSCSGNHRRLDDSYGNQP
jgi:flagellar protein FliT